MKLKPNNNQDCFSLIKPYLAQTNPYCSGEEELSSQLVKLKLFKFKQNCKKFYFCLSNPKYHNQPSFKLSLRLEFQEKTEVLKCN